MPKILITDDDKHLRKLVLTYAGIEGFICDEAKNGREALDKVEESDFDLVLLDVMMPGIDGFETLAKLRQSSRIPVILLTARSEEYDKLYGFNLGADDYVPKPFSPRELMARVNAVLKRSGYGEEKLFHVGSLTVDPLTRQVVQDGTPLSLTPKEYDLLLTFLRNEHRALNREQLLTKVWGYNYYGDTRTVDTHVKSLRNQLGKDRDLIQTVWGVGYRFERRADN